MAAGTHTISLVVTDNLGLASTATTHDVNVTEAPQIAFRAAATSSTNAITNRVTIPASVQLGDAMLLFVTTNSHAAVMTAPAGWTPAGTQTVRHGHADPALHEGGHGNRRGEGAVASPSRRRPRPT